MAKRSSGVKHDFQTNFTGGVLSENAFGRIDISKYDNALKVGKNIIIENPGGATKRPGTLFIQEYVEPYVRLFPFSFNADQTYLIVMTGQKVDIYKDDVLQATLVSPYLEAEITDIDWAQSADSMVLTHGDHPVQLLRRLGSDVNWELVPLPFVNQPTQLICTDGEKPLPNGTCNDLSTPVATPVWDAIQGYPKFCTFHSGRLFFATSKTLPQNIWGSVIQDFFNFDVGSGQDGEAIYDVLDTDQINPIVGIYSEKKLFAFTTGEEFANTAQVITPAASSWKKQSQNGSYGSVPPVTFDGGILYLDRSGRTIRQLLYNDGIEGYSSESISMFSEHLIRTPIAMGVLKGRLFQASNFLYIVNSDGTIAVLNMSRATGMAAWTQWTTQGSFKDILSFSKEIAYILVERRGKWILERLADGIYVDSGSVIETLTGTNPAAQAYTQDINGINTGKFNATAPIIQNNPSAILGDDSNFFGISFNTQGKGRIVIVIADVVVYKIEWFKDDPKQSINVFGTIYIPVNQFDENQEIEDLYFERVPQTEFYQYSMITDVLVDAGQNYIGGLPHLIGREVVTNLDGNVFRNQLVIPGDQLPGGGLLKSYPDGTTWLFNETPAAESYILKFFDVNNILTSIVGYYIGAQYPGLTLNEFWNAYPITQNGDPVINDEFLEEGTFVKEEANLLTYTANGSYTVEQGITSIDICMCGGGGGGGGGPIDGNGNGSGSGGSGTGFVRSTITVTPGQVIAITIGAAGQGNNDVPGTNGGTTTVGAISAQGGNGGAAGIAFGTSPQTPGVLGGGFGSAGRGFGSPNSTPAGNIAASFCGAAYSGGTSLAAIVGENFQSGGGPGGAGAQGNGANIRDNGTPETPTGYGAGGAGGSVGSDGSPGIAFLYLNGKDSSRKFYQTRKMQLVEATIPLTDGIVETNRSFNIGQAGLWFNVQMETLPFDAASQTNEPKRIVSITPRFVKTVGLTVANTLVPGRNFGNEVLGTAPQPQTGIKKIRVIGYTRDTTIRISQNDPLPMTLISLDIEIKI